MKKMKVKRYQAGLGVEGDYESSEDAKNLIAAAAREKADFEAAQSKMPDVGGPAKMASFGEAFKEARGRGDKTFEYMGKKYTTEMAGGKKATAPASTAKSETKPKVSSYAEAARSSKTLGDVVASDAAKQAEYREAVRSGKEKTLGTKLQEFGGRFRRALATGRPQGGEGMKKGGMVGSASKRADGCAQRGKTRGKMV